MSYSKRNEPKGPFEQRAIKEVIIRTVFISSRGMGCLADAFEQDDVYPFDPVPLETVALAATAVIVENQVRDLHFIDFCH